MRLTSLLIGLAACGITCPQGWAQTTLTSDTSLGLSSNANLTSTDPASDLYFRLGLTARFPVAKQNQRFSVRYTDYMSLSENDLLSLDYGTSWLQGQKDDQNTYNIRVFLRDYVHQNLGTFDEAFTHYGITGSKSWTSSSGIWTFTPQFQAQNYPSLSRADFDFSFDADADLTGDSEALTSLAFLPGINFSTVGDFSKFYLSISADHERPISEDSTLGLSGDLTFSIYLSRSVTSTVLARKKKGGTTTISSRETTILFSPNVYWSKTFSKVTDLRTEVFANLQGSRSGSFSYSELAIMTSFRWKIF